MSKYNSLIDYIRWRGDLNFKTFPFNDIDAMILSQLSSVRYGHAVPGAATVDELQKRPYKLLPTLEQVAQIHHDSFSGENSNSKMEEEDYILFEAGKSNRFKNIRMDGYICDMDSENIKQFSAVTFFLKKRLVYIAFRGTDDTFISWEENFRMSYMFPIPAQADAEKYLNFMAQGFLRKSIVGGHSKGGNMAVYASTFCKNTIQKSIQRIFAFDAPGFPKDLNSIESYGLIKDKIVGYMPVNSIIGTLMTVPYQNLVVNSDASSVWQHYMFNWEIMGTSPVFVEDRSEFSYRFEKIVSEKIDAIPEEDKPQSVSELFSVFRDNQIYKISDFSNMSFKQVLGLIKGARSISSANKDLLLSIVKLLWEDSRKK